MIDIDQLAKNMKNLGVSEEQISYALKPLQSASETLSSMIELFDDTPYPLIIDLNKLSRSK